MKNWVAEVRKIKFTNFIIKTLYLKEIVCSIWENLINLKNARHHKLMQAMYSLKFICRQMFQLRKHRGLVNKHQNQHLRNNFMLISSVWVMSRQAMLWECQEQKMTAYTVYLDYLIPKTKKTFTDKMNKKL